MDQWNLTYTGSGREVLHFRVCYNLGGRGANAYAMVDIHSLLVAISVAMEPWSIEQRVFVYDTFVGVASLISRSFRMRLFLKALPEISSSHWKTTYSWSSCWSHYSGSSRNVPFYAWKVYGQFIHSPATMPGQEPPPLGRCHFLHLNCIALLLCFVFIKWHCICNVLEK